jgi:hypothetical protein
LPAHGSTGTKYKKLAGTPPMTISFSFSSFFFSFPFSLYIPPLHLLPSTSIRTPRETCSRRPRTPSPVAALRIARSRAPLWGKAPLQRAAGVCSVLCQRREREPTVSGTEIAQRQRADTFVRRSSTPYLKFLVGRVQCVTVLVSL